MVKKLFKKKKKCTQRTKKKNTSRKTNKLPVNDGQKAISKKIEKRTQHKKKIVSKQTSCRSTMVKKLLQKNNVHNTQKKHQSQNKQA